MEMFFKLAEKSETNDEEKSIVGWGSRPTPDRDKELILSSAWNLDNYRKNPIILLSHNYSSLPIGKALWVKEVPGQGLKFKAKFANSERGNEVYELFRDGILNAFSVGFSPREGGYIDNPTEEKFKGLKRVYKDVDLLEISCVAVPANADALVEFVKSGKVKNKQLKKELEEVIEIIDDPVKELEIETIVEKVEVTDNYVHVPAPGEEGKHGDHKIRTVTLSKKDGIMGKYCVDCKSMISYMFDKDKYSKDQAMKWVKDHSKSIDDSIIEIKDIDETTDDWSEFIEEKATSQKCPADGGMFGKDNGKFPECKDCKIGDACKAAMPEKKEEPVGVVEIKLDDSSMKEILETITDLKNQVEELKSKMPIPVWDSGTNGPSTVLPNDNDVKIKMNSPEGLPSIYDITSAVSNALSPIGNSYPAEVSPYKYVVDLYPSQYPSGSVVYAVRQDGETEYYRESYTMDQDGNATLNGSPDMVEQSWVIDRYNKDFEDIETKVGMVLSGKNRKMIQDCVDALTALLESSISKELEEEEFEIEELETKAIEDEPDPDDELEIGEDEDLLEEKSDESEELEIDEDMLKIAIGKAVTESISNSNIFNVKETIQNTFKVLSGKVV